MGTPAETASSTELVLLCAAPQPIALAFRRAQSGIGDARDRLGWRLGLADVVQRFLVAALAAELRGLDLEPGKYYSALIERKLEAPSLGDWGRAACELARLILAARQPLVAERLARLLVEEDGRGGWHETRVTRDLIALVDLRNALFHRDGRPLPDEATAMRHLEEIEKPLEELCRALRVLRDHPVLYIQRKDEHQDGRVSARVLRFSGAEPTVRLCEDASRLGVPTQTPFLLSVGGDVLLLPPLVDVGRNSDTGDLELCVIAAWDSKERRFLYSDPRGGKRGTLNAERPFSAVEEPRGLTTLSAATARRRGAVPAAFARLWPTEFDAAEGPPRIPGYRVQGRIGKGATSTVWLGHDERADRPPGGAVALKVLHPVVAQHEGQRQRLRAEHGVLRTIQHPAVVRVDDLIEGPDHSPCLVMEYVRGEDLQSAVERRGPLSVTETATIIEALLDALTAVHARRVLHRDIKPSNVIVDCRGQIRLIDFGIALSAGSTRLTRTFDAVGTLSFAAPEQIAGSDAVDDRTDLYAVGRLIEFLLLGVGAIDSREREKLPPGLLAVIRKATQPEAKHRFQSAAEMLAVFQERRTTGWGGAPVQEGDRLDRSFEVTRLIGSYEGFYVFDGSELASDETVTVALAPYEAESRRRLSNAWRAYPRSQRAELGLRGLLETAQDKLLFAVLDSGSPLDRLRALLCGEPLALARTPNPAPRPPSPPRDPSDPFSGFRNLGVRLTESSGSWTEIDVLRHHHAIARLLDVLVLIARAGTGEDPLERSGSVMHALKTLKGYVDATAFGGRRFKLLESILLPVVAARNQIAHHAAMPDELPLEGFRSSLVHVYGELLALADEMLSSCGTSELQPWLDNLDGDWVSLARVGSKLVYLTFDLEARSRPAPPEIVEQVGEGPRRQLTYEEFLRAVEQAQGLDFRRVIDEFHARWRSLGGASGTMKSGLCLYRRIGTTRVLYARPRDLVVFTVGHLTRPSSGTPVLSEEEASILLEEARASGVARWSEILSTPNKMNARLDFESVDTLERILSGYARFLERLARTTTLTATRDGRPPRAPDRAADIDPRTA